ncbi:MAG: TonB-dependent receptor [Nitrospira sp.]|nr:TonB-dependent receptor [Nitrospira sp.]
MNRSWSATLFITACSLSVPLHGWAETSLPIPRTSSSTEQEIQQEVLYLKEETVSIASRYEQPISDAPSNVYVITDEDIRMSGAIDIPTVLRRIPGLEIMQMSGADFNVSVRGNNQPMANKLLVLVDGRSIYVDLQGTVYWKALPVTLPEIKRIEVLKGPASALYGFNAFDGIVNIITKTPDELKGTTLQFGGGELGTITSAAVTAGTVGNLGFRVSAGRDQNQQWREQDALAFRSHKLNVATTYALSGNGTLHLSGGVVDTNRYDGQIGETVSSSTRLTQAYLSAGLEWGTFSLRTWWSRLSSDSLPTTNPLLSDFLTIANRDGSSQSLTSADTYNLDLQHMIGLGPSHQFTYGLNYRHISLFGNISSGLTREDRLGLFVQDEWRLAPTLSVVAGGRYDIDTFINPTISPRLAVIYHLSPNHSFRTSASVAYRPPTLIETSLDQRARTTIPTGLAPPFPTTVTNSIPVLGSTNLDPEQIISCDLGYQGWWVQHRVRTRGDLYFNHLSDLIGNRNASPSQATFVNDRGHANIYGLEAGVEILATAWLSGYANYSYEFFDQTFLGTVRRGAPHHKANVGLRGIWVNGVSADMSYHYVGQATYPVAHTFTALAPFGVPFVDPHVSSYNLLNLRLGYRFWQQQAAAGYVREAEVAVSVFNALNDRHREHPLGDLIGSRVMGWLTVKL